MSSCINVNSFRSILFITTGVLFSAAFGSKNIHQPITLEEARGLLPKSCLINQTQSNCILRTSDLSCGEGVQVLTLDPKVCGLSFIVLKCCKQCPPPIVIPDSCCVGTFCSAVSLEAGIVYKVPDASHFGCQFKTGIWSECDTDLLVKSRTDVIARPHPSMMQSCQTQVRITTPCYFSMPILPPLGNNNRRSLALVPQPPKKRVRKCHYDQWSKWTLCDSEHMQYRLRKITEGATNKCTRTILARVCGVYLRIHNPDTG